MRVRPSGAVDFDELSVRVVGPAGVLVARQQFTDRVCQGRLDPAGNSRFEASTGSTVDHNALSISNATSPQLIINSNRLGRDGYGNSVEDFGWKRAVLDLSAYAGSTSISVSRPGMPRLMPVRACCWKKP